MDMSTAVRTVLSKYATFSGRAPRSEFWWWALFVAIMSLVAGLIDGFLIAPLTGHAMFARDAYDPVSSLFGLAVLLPGLAVGARRLHDIDKSGWWLLLSFIPLIGGLILLYWAIKPSQPGTNRFG